ncbi:Probable RNA-directed DNA polymerase from transposon BS [Eumeta japonica]|uniref:Probable RNA-directed DNA polymerase from transposon BS n=1 Tax=Eumeta variegata TaxID=151549 RepID=A0A4C1WEF3_EUMVA|nr:Probable RNA-directed DNA polymerase from transposon BS [Eumeta japonica]
MEEIKPSHKAFWAVTNALKTEGYTPIPPLKKPDNSVAIDDAEIAECLADSIETQCSQASPPHDIAHISRIEEEVLQKTSLEPKDDLAPVSLSEVQTLVKLLNTRKAPSLDGIGNKAIKCFSIPLLSLLVAIYKRVPKNCSSRLEGGRRAGVPQGSTLSSAVLRVHKRYTASSSSGVQLALFADDTALFYGKNRSTRFTSSPQRAIDELGQWFRKWRIEVNPDKSAAIQFKYGVTLDKNLHFRDHIERVRNTALFYKARLGAMLGRKSKLSRRNKRTIYKICIRTVMTYASLVFAHTAPKALHRLQVIQNKFCRAATDAHWCVRNSILHRDLELPTISKYMKDASKRFFDIAGSHPNALLRAAVDYQPPDPTHLIRRPPNVFIDPPDALTAAVESLNDVNNTHD